MAELMRGFLVGSLVLVVLYVALQPHGAAAAQKGGNALVAGLRRLLSPQVAGVPDLSSRQLRNAGTAVGGAVAGGVLAGANVLRQGG